MVLVKLGPLGDYSIGKHWEETNRHMANLIFVTYSGDVVTSIQFGYAGSSGVLTMSKKYGSNKQNQSTRIVRAVRLKNRSEYVTGISGEKFHYGISSLTFHTNEGKHQAFHAEFQTESWRARRRPERFEFRADLSDRSEFGGFFGSCDANSLKSIGLSI